MVKEGLSMAFFDDLSKTLSDKGKVAAHKAREAAEVLQVKAQIVSEKSKLKELYGAVGVLYYKKHRNDEDNEFADLFKEIGNVLTNIAAMEEKVQELDGTLVCPNCKNPMKKGSAFCSKCGTALKTESETEEQTEDTIDDIAVIEENIEKEPEEDGIFVEEEIS